MPIALILEILEALSAVAQTPEVSALVQSAKPAVQAPAEITPEQEADIRQKLAVVQAVTAAAGATAAAVIAANP